MKNLTDNPTMDDGALFEQYLEEGNYALAFEVLKRLAEKSRERKLQLAYFYEKGKGTEVDEEKALELVREVYSHCSPTPYSDIWEDAALRLADYYRRGIGTEADPERAQKILDKLKDDKDRLDECLSR